MLLQELKDRAISSFIHQSFDPERLGQQTIKEYSDMLQGDIEIVKG